MLKTPKFTILQSVCRFLLLNLLRIVFCLFSTWSFTLCKNDLGTTILILLRRENFVSSFAITNLSVCCEQRTGLSVLSYCSVCGLRGVWLSCLVFPGLSDAIEESAAGVLSLHRATKFIIGLDFAVTTSSPELKEGISQITLNVVVAGQKKSRELDMKNEIQQRECRTLISEQTDKKVTKLTRATRAAWTDRSQQAFPHRAMTMMIREISDPEMRRQEEEREGPIQCPWRKEQQQILVSKRAASRNQEQVKRDETVEPKWSW